MRSIILCLLLTVVLAFFSACRTSEDSDSSFPGWPDHSQGAGPNGFILWGGMLDGSYGINHISSEWFRSVQLLPVENMARLQIGSGDADYLITAAEGTIYYQSLSGTTNEISAVEPSSFSPNARRVLFEQDGSLYSASVAGTGSLLIAEGAIHPAFSPDMNLLIYTKADGIYLEPPADPDPQPLDIGFPGTIQIDEPDPDLNPVFSPDGSLVAAPMHLMLPNGDANIYTYIIDTQTRAAVTWLSNARHPSFSYDNQLLVYESNGLLFVWDFVSTHNTQVSFGDGAPDSHPIFSRDGRYIVYEHKSGDGELLLVRRYYDPKTWVLTADDSALIAGADWYRPPFCSQQNSAPDVTAVEILLDGAPAGDPAVVTQGSNVTARLTLSDSDCNLSRGITFISTGEDETPRTISFDFREGAGCDAATDDVIVPTDYSGTLTLTFTVEDDCGATGAGASATVQFNPGGDDTSDDAADDTATDDTTGDDTAL